MKKGRVDPLPVGRYTVVIWARKQKIGDDLRRAARVVNFACIIFT